MNHKVKHNTNPKFDWRVYWRDLMKCFSTHMLHLQNYESNFDSLQNMNTIFSSSQQKTSMYLNLVSRKYPTYHLHNIMTIANAVMMPSKLKGFSPSKNTLKDDLSKTQSLCRSTEFTFVCLKMTRGSQDTWMTTLLGSYYTVCFFGF